MKTKLEAAFEAFREELIAAARRGEWREIRRIVAGFLEIRIFGPWQKKGGLSVRPFWLGGRGNIVVAPDDARSPDEMGEREASDRASLGVGAILIDNAGPSTEGEIRACLAEGLEVPAIASKLKLAPSTVQNWIRRIRREDAIREEARQKQIDGS